MTEDKRDDETGDAERDTPEETAPGDEQPPSRSADASTAAEADAIERTADDSSDAKTDAAERTADESPDAKTDAAEPPADDAPAAPTPPPEPRPESRRPSRWPALLASAALGASMVALLLSLWLWNDARVPDDLAAANRDRLASLSGSLDETRAAIAEAERALSSLRSEDGALGDRVDDLERTMEDDLEPLLSVPGRVSSLEASLAALQGISSGVRDTWLLAEAEYYMEIANAQLQLAGNPGLAEIALELADERVAKVANPGLTDVRRALADELRSLGALDTPDVEGAVLTLASLADTVETLPLANEVVPPDERGVDVDEELSGFDRAMASLRNAMSDVVSVRRTDEQLKPLLPPEATFFLRRNVELRLQTARLALLKGEQAIFEQSLDDAAAWLEQYFDTDKTPVSSVLDTIAELGESQATAARPDISRSLTLLRRFLAREAEDRRTDSGPGQ